MRFLLLISADEDITIGTGGFPAWLADLERRGVLEMHAGLHPSATATTIRVRDEDLLLTDGPLAEGREQIGGFALIDCAGLDEAVAIAAAHPASRVGRVEIRPVR